MKKVIVILSTLALLLCCSSSCGGKSDYAREREAKKESIYQEGYDAGYEEGYRAAMDKAPEIIEFYVDEDIWDLCYDIEDNYGIHPEDAVIILANYADVPDEVNRQELIKAIWAIRRYYYDSSEILNKIEDYWID